MSDNTIEYLIRLKDEFTSKMQAAAGAAAKGGAAIGQGLAVAALSALKFKDTIGAGWDVLNGNYESFGKVLGALPGPIGQVGEIVGSTLGKMIQETEDAAEGYRKLSAATGASVEFLSGFKEAADDVRVSGEAVDSALIKFSKGLGGIKDASEGAMESGKGVAGTLADLGIAAGDAEGHMRPMADLLPEVADAFSRMADGPQKTAIAIQLFGKQGAELIPILNKGKEGLDEMMKSAEAAGLTMSGKTIDSVNKLKEAQDQLSDSWTGFSRRVAPGAISALTSIVDSVNHLTGASGTMSEAFADVNLTLLQFGNSGKLTDEQFKKLKEDGENATKVLNRFAEGGAGSNAETQRLAQELQKVHPELFKLAEAQTEVGKSAAELAKEQFNAGNALAEYEVKTQSLIDITLKRDTQLAEIKKKEDDLVEAQKNGFISSEQLAKAQGHLSDETDKVQTEFGLASDKIRLNVDSTAAMDKAAQGAAERQKGFAEATRDAARAQEELKGKLDNLTAGIGSMPEKMDKAKQAVLTFKLATGQITTDKFEQELIGSGLTKQFVKGAIDLQKFKDLSTSYYSGAITGEQALKEAGAWKDPAFISLSKQYREIEKVTGDASASELAHADYIKITTRILSSKKVSLDDVAEAQLYLNKANEADTKMLKEAKADLDAKKISELDYTKVTLNVSEAHDKLASSTRKVEDAFHKGTVTTTGSTIITDTFGQHLDDVGLKLDKFGNIVAAIPAQKDIKVTANTAGLDEPNDKIRALQGLPPIDVPIKSNTTGFVEPVTAAKSEAEKPVTISVDFKSATAPTFGTGASGPAPVTLPVAFDTSGIEGQLKIVQDTLDKLGPSKGISIALDTTSFDQNILRIGDDLKKLPAQNINVSLAVDSSTIAGAFKKLTDFKFDTKIISVAAEYDRTMNGKTGAFDVIAAYSFDEKVVSIDGEETNVYRVFDAVDAEILASKTVDIFGNNGGAMGAIAAVKAGLDGLHDKTVFINVQQGAPSSPSPSAPPDERRGGVSFNDNTTLSNNNNFGKGFGVKLADTINVRSDLDIEMLAVRVADLITGRG